jgi:hypothetical protein
LSHKECYKLLKPNLDSILFAIVYNRLLFKEEDVELFNDDPHEFIRRTFGNKQAFSTRLTPPPPVDVTSSIYSARTAASNFLIELAERRTKDCLLKIIAFAATQIQSYTPPPLPDRKLPETQRSSNSPFSVQGGPVMRDAGYQMLGAINQTILQQPPHFPSVEFLIASYAANDLSSDVPFLRSRVPPPRPPAWQHAFFMAIV